MNLISWIKKNWRKITFRKIWNYIVAEFRYYFLNWGWREEQANWRLTQVEIKSSECYNKGICICDCKLEELVFGDDSCEKECFPEWKNKREWIKFRSTIKN